MVSTLTFRPVSMEESGQAESSKISTSLEVEQIDVNLFRSVKLFMPIRARGVFGGQVISQAIAVATKCVDPAFGLHVSNLIQLYPSEAEIGSLRVVIPCEGLRHAPLDEMLIKIKCYFLLSASPAIPIVYFVERLRDGRSYSTRSVKAVQNGKIIFQALCSFHIPEPWQPSHQWPAPVGVPSLEDCELEEDLFRRRAARDDLDKRVKAIYLNYAAVRISHPLGTFCVTWSTTGACQWSHRCQKSRSYGHR